MPALSSFDYAVIRVVPRVDREEFLNAGVILLCQEQRFLDARIHLDENRLLTLWPDLDLKLVRTHLEAFPKVCRGEAQAASLGRLSQRERFHWLVSPRSTIVQVSPVHSGLCESPETTIEQLVERLLKN